MIVTDYFVYIHVSRTGGTFLNWLILDQVPGARMLQHHEHLADLPSAYVRLPVIGFARNPWDWYVSMYNDYRRKRQFVYQIVSEQGALDFKRTVARFLSLGDGSDESRKLLRRLAEAAPETIDARKPEAKHLPGLRSEHFARFPADVGYYGWLFNLMLHRDGESGIHIGRFENLREDALRLFEETGAPITKGMMAYLRLAPPLNAGKRPENYEDAYGPELRRLVTRRERVLIESRIHIFPSCGSESGQAFTRLPIDALQTVANRASENRSLAICCAAPAADAADYVLGNL